MGHNEAPSATNPVLERYRILTCTAQTEVAAIPTVSLPDIRFGAHVSSARASTCRDGFDGDFPL